MCMYPSIHPSFHPSILPSFHPSIHPSMHIYIYSTVICLSMFVFIYLLICSFVDSFSYSYLNLCFICKYMYMHLYFRPFRVAEFVTRLPLLEDRPKARQRCVFKHILPHFRKTHRDGNSSPRHGCPGAGLVTDIADKSRYKHQNETCQHQKHQQESPQSYHP